MHNLGMPKLCKNAQFDSKSVQKCTIWVHGIKYKELKKLNKAGELQILGFIFGILLVIIGYCRLYMDIHQFRVSNLSMVGKSKNLKNKKGYYCNQSPVFLGKIKNLWGIK